MIGRPRSDRAEVLVLMPPQLSTQRTHRPFGRRWFDIATGVMTLRLFRWSVSCGWLRGVLLGCAHAVTGWTSVAGRPALLGISYQCRSERVASPSRSGGVSRQTNCKQIREVRNEQAAHPRSTQAGTDLSKVLVRRVMKASCARRCV